MSKASHDELEAEQIRDALRRCVGAASIAEDGRCEGCPLYSDHYCVDTLVSLIEERIEHYENQAGDGKSI